MASPAKQRRRGRGLGQTLVVGSTGSIGMGKSTVSAWFREFGVPVNDADAVVHGLYGPGGEAVAPIRELFGDAVLGEDGGINRTALSKFVVGEQNAANLDKVEAIVFPLVDRARDKFIEDATARGEALVILDIPLLFERGSERLCDLVTVASAPEDVQRKRVLARPGMTDEKFKGMMAKQTPDKIKRELADCIFDTGLSEDETKAQVKAFVAGCGDQINRERQCKSSMPLVGLACMVAVIGVFLVRRR